MEFYLPKFVGPKSFFTSRKAWVSVLSVALAGALLYLGALSDAQFTEILKYVLTLWVGTMSAEKVSKMFALRVLHDSKSKAKKEGQEVSE